MPSAAYFRRQADICVRLSVIASDQELVTRLLAMAEEYKTKAGAMEENDPELIPPPMTGLDAPGEGVDRA
jgi:hypothetical protein